MNKIIEVRTHNLEQIIGETLIDVEHCVEKHSCCEGSQEVILNFSNGKEISIYFYTGDDPHHVMVEGD